MHSFIQWYQNIPSRIDAEAFQIGDFSVRWYSLAIMLAFGIIYLLGAWRIRKKEVPFTHAQLVEFLSLAVLAALIGGRIGYGLFYDSENFFSNPVQFFSPFNFSGDFTGIFGLSYHGALFMLIIAALFFCRRQSIPFHKWAAFLIPVVPIGYFFGRMGNFLNNELLGKKTDALWGMYFNGEKMLRHPSQLYEAVLEGLVLFAVFLEIEK